jgi:adenylate cyclase
MAVRAAAALSKEYTQESAKTGRAHDLRIGVHVGDVAVDADGDLYGDCVNAAARIEAAVDPGQVVVSEDVWRQIRGREELRFKALGNRSLKGMGLIDLYAVTPEESPTAVGISDATGARPDKQQEKIRSIAVLPFADLSAERDQEYSSDGVAEEILNALSKVDGLHVPARIMLCVSWNRPRRAANCEPAWRGNPPRRQRLEGWKASPDKRATHRCS